MQFDKEVLINFFYNKFKKFFETNPFNRKYIHSVSFTGNCIDHLTKKMVETHLMKKRLSHWYADTVCWNDRAQLWENIRIVDYTFLPAGLYILHVNSKLTGYVDINYKGKKLDIGEQVFDARLPVLVYSTNASINFQKFYEYDYTLKKPKSVKKEQYATVTCSLEKRTNSIYATFKSDKPCNFTAVAYYNGTPMKYYPITLTNTNKLTQTVAIPTSKDGKYCVAPKGQNPNATEWKIRLI